MDWLNYNHLLYFWTVVREGSVTRAADRLHLTQPTISTQLRQLERALGEKLFRLVGRRLILTDVGQVIYQYADQIFSLGREMVGAVKGTPTERRPPRLIVGICQVVHKLIAYRLIEPAFRSTVPVHVVCRENELDHLLGELAVHRLDLVLSDCPANPMVKVRVYNHLLGECGVTWFGTAELVRRFRRNFPRSLNGAPVVLPTEGTALRRSLTQWFEEQEIRPKIVAEFEDSALLKVAGQAGFALFPGPSATEKEIRRQYDVEVLGRVPQIHERFYAITVERRLTHPLIVAISKSARRDLFAND